MNKLLKTGMLAVLAGLLGSCTPDEYSLGAPNVAPAELVQGIAFTVTHDPDNQNIVYLESKMQGYTPLWNHPQGRSQEPKVTLKIAFAGTYDITFGVQTRGGIVYGEPVQITIDNFNADFVSDPLWTMLAGGAGEEKTWYLDLDVSAVSRGGAGPLFFYGLDDSWETVTEGKTVEGDSWNWCPDYAANSWLFGAADFGTMTFDMKDGAHIKVEHLTISARGTENGTFLIDVDDHTLKLVDAAPLHDVNRDAVVTAWGDIRILSLTADYLQLGVVRDNDPAEGLCLLVYNFISKDYKDNWTPGEAAEPEPSLPDGWKDNISTIVQTSIKWELSPETPFNWATLDGTLMNNWSTAADYPGWSGFAAGMEAGYAGFSLTLNSTNGDAEYVAPDGSTTTGSYTLDDDGYYTFTGFTPLFNITTSGNIKLETSTDNQWRVTKVEKDGAGNVTGMWVGVRHATNPEYMVYHLIPSGVVAVPPTPPTGTLLAFDPGKVYVGDLEGNGNLRIEIYNEYGDGTTKTASPIDVTAVNFTTKMEVTFTLAGITSEGATGTYDAKIGFIGGGWTQGTATSISGDGTYTVTFDGSNSATINVFVIDIAGMANDITTIGNVTVTVDQIELF
ncbi:hypothetical protein AGMMS4956_10420 [Bacteroidia bacterium]|nr:hypothetical protein AGMMS4956_10420 [Bacteroidia bacterium]